MTRSVWLDRLVAGTALVVLALLGCSDGGNDPVSPSGPAGPALPSLDMTGQVVSEPVVFPVPLRGSFAAGSGSSAGSSYVSYEPGSIPEADSIEIRNPANGSLVGARMIDGGLDPVPIPASSGDSLEITTLASGRMLARGKIPVPEETPPRIVRTDPARRSPRVPLNIRVKVIFTEPVSAATVTTQTVRLLLNGQPVPASVSLSVDALQAELIPDQPLQPATAYVISVTTGVLDLAGDPLEQEFVSDMTTEPPVLAGTIVFARAQPTEPVTIWSVRADGSGVVQLTNVYSLTPALSPDGQLIAYFLDDGTTRSLSIMNVDGTVILDVDGNVPRVVVTGGAALVPEWSPDGSMIAFASQSSDPTSWGIYVVSIDWTVPSRRWRKTRLTSGQPDWSPSWSPDGGRIVFASVRNGLSDIFLMNSDGSNVSQLTNHPADDSYPGWSPDGTKILFSSGRNRAINTLTDEGGDIYVMDADGSNPTALTTKPGDHFTAAWSPSGTHIVFASRADIGSRFGTLGASTIWVMNADGSGKFKLTNPQSFQDDYVPDWGP